MIHTSRKSIWLRLMLLALLAITASPAGLWADEEDDEAAIILAQLEDAAPAHEESLPKPIIEMLDAPGELPKPGGDDEDPTTIDLSTEEELLEMEEAIPMCTTGQIYDGNLWYHRMDFVYLFKQPLKDSITIADGVFDPNDAASLSTNDLKLRWRPGMRYTIGRELGTDNLDRDQSLELTFFGLFDWYQTTTLNGFNGTASVANPFMVGFLDANSVRADRRARLNSVELNFRRTPRLKQDRLIMAHDGTWTRQCAPDFVSSVFGGLRYIRLDEEFSIRSIRTVAGSGYDAIQEIHTENDMFGVQIGTDMIHQDCRWHWGIRGKVAAMINAADRKRRDFVDGEVFGTSEFRQKGDDDQMSLALEVGMFASYQIHPKVAARVAYDAMWLHGVVIAPDGMEQFGSGLDRDIDANENGIFHGLSLGLETKW